MKVIGLTGGIGSGKSSILSVFKEKGIPAFNADQEAKKLMQEDTNLLNKLRQLFGDNIFEFGKLDRNRLATIVFSDPSKLAELNALIHPVVATRFESFKKAHKTHYLIKEAAILFETGGWKNCDQTILVCAPLEQRIERVIQRDNSTREAVISRINNQWSDEKKIPLADFVIHNENWNKTLLEINAIHFALLQ